MRSRLVLLALLVPALAACLLPPTRAGAQLAELQPAARVRLRAPGVIAGRLQGVVIARTADTVTIATPSAAPLQVPLARITSAEVSRGKSHRDGALKGLKWGTGLGLVSGILGAIGYEECTGDDCRDELTRGEAFTTSLVGGALVGAGIGAMIGSEHWERLDLPVRNTVRPTRRGAAVVLTYAFR